MNFKKVISVLLCMLFFVLVLPANEVNAWKVKTHNYSANLILEEVMSNGGTVEIAPFGRFDVASEFYTALQKYPRAFRAGSLGPDAFPDIYVGQGFIHPLDEMDPNNPNDDITSGMWIRQMVENAMSLPENSEERYETVAFLLGYMTHYAGDLFGHTYINQISNGAYPDMADLADPEKAEQALSIILKHISSEGIIDSNIPQKYMQGEYININAPNKFITDSFIFDGTKDNGLSSMYDGMDAPMHFKYLVEVRSFVKQKADYYRQYSNSKNIVDYAENTVICNYLDAWLDDIDRAIDQWVTVSERIGQVLLDSGDQNDMEAAAVQVRGWVDSYGKYITPVPDVLIDALNLPGNIATFFKDKLGITVLQDMYDEFNAHINEMIVNFMIYDVIGMTKEQVEEMKKAFSMPQMVLGEEVISKLLIDMENFNKEVSALEQEFTPFYNTITMVKLILIGPGGYNRLISMVKGVPDTGYNYSTANVEVDNLKVSIKTKGGTSKYKGLFGVMYPYADQHGTDDDIYFGVKFKNGTSVEKLFDKSGYNDFESGDYDTYEISLGDSYKLGDISQFYLKKVGTGLPGPDWRPEYFDVSAYIGNVKYKDLGRTKIDYYIKGSTTKAFNAGFGNETYRTALNSGIVDFIGSLDNSLQWQHENFLLWSDPELREGVFYRIFKDVEKYDDPEFDPYVFLDSVEEEEIKEDELADSLDYVNASGWAVPEMKSAVANGLVKDFDILNDCRKNITRAEFAALAINLYEAMTGKEAQASPSNTFNDTSDINILKANNTGIINGKGKGIFAPEESITREAMATMFKRTIDAAFAHMNKTVKAPAGDFSVEDSDQISSWALESVQFVYLNNIITGSGTNFNPLGTAPVEQAIAVINRVYEKYRD